MANYSAIAQVSEALIEMLQSRITQREDVVSINRNEIVLTSPDSVGDDSDTRLSLYLYQVERHQRQQGRTITENDVRKAPPLSLNLHYLLTAYPSTTGTSDTTNTSDQHNALGLAMQVLYDNSVFEGDTLGNSFDSEAEITISMDSDSEDTVPRIWDSFRDVPLYPSMTYEVGPVHIESLRKEEIQRVKDRELNTDQKR